MANSSASSQSPLPKPLMTNTSGAMMAMKRIISHAKRFKPTSKLVGARCPVLKAANAPKVVRAPVSATTAKAVPETTLLPIQQMRASGVLMSFSAGIDSPVSAAWFTNKFLLESSSTSAGTISPALKCTTSPGTRSCSGTTCKWPPTELNLRAGSALPWLRCCQLGAARWRWCAPWL